MSKALAWIRKSKGDEKDIGLQEQRREVFTLAEEFADDIDKLDLGVQTGFSTLSRDGDDLLDEQKEVKNAVHSIREGEYDYLVAYDDTRVARDGYYKVIRHACAQGDTETVYVADIEEDDMGHGVRREVEKHVKQDEIQKARQAIAERKERGYDHGRPPFGFEYDDEGKHWVQNENFETAKNIIHAREKSDPDTYDEIAERTGVSHGTISRILDRKEMYTEKA